MTDVTINHAARVLESRGWTISETGGEVVARIAKGDEQGQIILQSRNVRGETKITYTGSASTVRFNEAVARISGDGAAAQEPIEQCRILRRQVEYIDDDFAGMEAEFQEWWGQQDLTATVRRLVSDYSHFGSGPLHHLAALALCQETEVLKGIRERFENGDKSGFLPYITVDYVSRAIDLASEAPLTA